MRRSIPVMWVLVAALLGDRSAGAQGQDPGTKGASSDKRKQRLVALVLPGVRRVPGYEKVRPYTSPDSEGDPPIEPTDVKAVESTEETEALVLQHPFLSPLIGAVVHGARVPVKGVVHAPGKAGRGCATHLWYALDPWGYVCSRSVKPTAEAPTQEVAMPVPEGERVPYHYVMVGVPEGEDVPMWGSLESARADEEPERQLQRGDTVAVLKTLKMNGAQYYVSVEGKVLPAEGTFPIDAKVSAWRGEVLDDKTVFPFGWVTPETVKVYAVPDPRTKPIETLPRRTRVVIAEEQGKGGRRMLRIADGPGAGQGTGPGAGPGEGQGQGQGTARWLRAADVNEVRRIPRPEGISPAAQWIDVDLGEQVLVAYMGEQPVYATLTSSGRAIPTPRGNYPVWAKVSAISMKSQAYEDKAYFVNKVPWVLFFQAHNAIHGAYWHDRFGVSKSHGCVNVAPLDARYLFEWLTPVLPSGWTGVRPPDLMASPTVHVRNSHERVELLQERSIGPPDKELEALKLEEAEARRAAEGGAATPATEAPTGMQP